MPELQKKPSYPIAAKYNGPGPGGFMLPSSVGFKDHNPCLKRWPAFTMRMALKDVIGDQSPGPAAYGYASKLTHKGLAHDPQFSIAMRLKYGEADQTPGPAAYTPETWRKFRSPAWHIALPFPKLKFDIYPGPNQYQIPAIIGVKNPYIPNAPKFTMRMKLVHGSFTEDLTQSPGANAYSNINLETIKTRAPAFTMRPRRGDLEGTNSPGPAAYAPSLLHKERQPAFSLGIRHSPYSAQLRVPEAAMMLDWD